MTSLLDRIRSEVGKPPQNQRVILWTIARMTSSRFPGKSILPLAGMPAWWHSMKRCEAAARLCGADPVGAAIITGANPENDILCEQARRYGYDCIRHNPESDVIGRQLKAFEYYDAGLAFTSSSDAPLAWFEHLSVQYDVWKRFNHEGAQFYLGNKPSGNPNIHGGSVTTMISIKPRWVEELAEYHSQVPEERESSGLALWRNPELRRQVVTPRDAYYQYPWEMYGWWREYVLCLDNYADGVMMMLLYDMFWDPRKPDVPVDARKCIEFIDAHPEYHYNAERKQSALNDYRDNKQAEYASVIYLEYCELVIAPPDSKKLYCAQCGEFMGYVTREGDLHAPDSTLVTGTARLCCTHGHFRIWQETWQRSVDVGNTVMVQGEV